ncbi:unnamed protein product [Anisakis simplex]|uniref:RanBD1 domain-containing protein n=1 Tax=Anisakis simplex TaxID=6269 RepID=A0A0M3JVY8_ANISI|nr:unnamed protein product [Anisakis simplex]
MPQPEPSAITTTTTTVNLTTNSSTAVNGDIRSEGSAVICQDQKASVENQSMMDSSKNMPQQQQQQQTQQNQRDECRSLKNVDSDMEEDDPNRHLAKVEIPRDIRNRVKLYVLCDQRIWDDKGTGHVACVPSPEHQGATFIVVRLEQNGW